jgi:hypothetical protein
MALDAFKPGDRVELVRHYSFWGDPPPQGTVISKTNRRVCCKMDRSGKLIRFLPDDLRHVERRVLRKQKPRIGALGPKVGV